MLVLHQVEVPPKMLFSTATAQPPALPAILVAKAAQGEFGAAARSMMWSRKGRCISLRLVGSAGQ